MPSAKKSDRKSDSNEKKKDTKKRSQSAEKKKDPAPKQEAPQKSVNYRIRSIILAACGILSFLLLIFSGQVAWEFLRSVLYGLFGLAALLIPVLLFYLSFMSMKEQKIHRLKTKLAMCLSLVVLFSIDIFVLTANEVDGYFNDLGTQFMNAYKATGVLDRGSGLLGAILGHPLKYGLGSVQTIVVDTIILLALIFIIAKVSLYDIGKKAKSRVDKARQLTAERRKKRMEKQKEQQKERPLPERYGDEDIYVGEEPKPEDTTQEAPDTPFEPINFEHDDKPVNEIDFSIPPEAELDYDAQGVIDLIKRANSTDEPTEPEEAPPVEEEQPLQEKAPEDDVPFFSDDIFQTYEPQDKKSGGDENAEEEFAEEVSSGMQKKTEYIFPPIQLLKKAVNNNSEEARREIEEKSRKLVSALESFNVKVRITNVCSGPSVTRYEVQPAPGVKISKITNLADDIALNLAANGVRIEAPIPGKAAVGIEVPNKSVAMVSIRELIDSEVFKTAKSKLTCVLGRDISGQIVTTDLASMPHLLIAGTTGSGKSVCVNSLLISILYRATPDEVKLLLIDPKMVEFSKYKGIPHLLVPVVSDPKKAAAALNWAVSEMENRYRLLSEYDCKDINSYNELIETNLKYIEEQTPEEGEEPEPLEVNGLPVKTEKMFRCVIAIDELADLMMTAGNEVEESICRLAQKARAAGMHLVIATQRPSVNVITGVIKANIPSRISLKVSSNTDSRTILDTGGAEKLIGKGDMLYMPVGAPKPLRVQGCFASDAEINKVTRFIKGNYDAQYNEEVEERIRKITLEGADAEEDENDFTDYDEKIEEAIKVVVDAGQASTSLVQRRLKVGYARAGRMIDEMEQLGIVGPHQGSKPREVLMTYQDWLERKNLTSRSEDSSVSSAEDDSDFE